MRTDSDSVMVDTKGIGQPVKWKGIGDQIFVEWTHILRTFMLGRFGEHILGALAWASRQRKIVVQGCGLLQRKPQDTLDWCFWSRCQDQIDEIDDSVVKLHAYLVSFYNRSSKPNRSKLWRRKWLGSLETTAQRVRPDIIHETCDDSSAGSEPAALSASRGSGNCSEKLALKETSIRDVHRQGRTALPGIRRQLCGGNVPVDAKEHGEDCYVRQRGRGLPGVVRQTAGLQEHETVNHNEWEQENNKERWSNGCWCVEQRKVERKRQERLLLGKERAIKAKTTWTSSGTAARRVTVARNWNEWWWSRGKGKGRLETAQSYEHADGWTWSDEHVDGLWKTSDWQTGTGSGWWTRANDWTPWE